MNINLEFANAIRLISAEAIEKAKSGHPGTPLGCADMIAELFLNHLRFNNSNPSWIGRDRFILSAGHGSMLLYTALHLTGYDISKDDIMNFRTTKTHTCAGHPEHDILKGIECTTGPLGQGIGMAVGMAIAGKILQHNINKKLFDYKIYCLAGDGCMMEGIAYEAMSLAGHLGLDNLVIIFDSNNITIDGETNKSISENHIAKMNSFGFATSEFNGHDVNEIRNNLIFARNTKKPVFLKMNTIIGKHAGGKENTSAVHGAPIGEQAMVELKKICNISDPFDVKKNVIQNIQTRINPLYDKWIKDFNLYTVKYDNFIKNKTINLKIPLKTIQNINEIESRKAMNIFFDYIQKRNSSMIFGSADLGKSVLIQTSGMREVNAEKFKANYVNYGIREHAMGAIINGLTLSNFRAFGGTFLVFSDYMKPAIRMSAIMNLNSVFVFSHDSIRIGQDGPTHQPIEHLTMLRSIPNVNVFRPCDAIEMMECIEIIVQQKSGTACLVTSKDKFTTIRNKITKDNLSTKGAYIIHSDSKKPSICLYGSGGEVKIAKEVRNILKCQFPDLKINIVSIPCFNLLYQQSKEYQDSILYQRKKIHRVGIEYSTSEHMKILLGHDSLIFSAEKFGISGTEKEVMNFFDLTIEKIANRIIQHFDIK